MNTQDDTLHPAVREARVAQQLETLKSAIADVHAPAQIEAMLARAFRNQRKEPERPRLWWMPPLALVATVSVVSWLVRAPAPALDIAQPAFVATDFGPFLALKPLERIALKPQATVVTTEFPRVLLAQWGLPVAPERAGEPVRAEMMYSADGEALAVRFIP